MPWDVLGRFWPILVRSWCYFGRIWDDVQSEEISRGLDTEKFNKNQLFFNVF